MIQTKLKQPMFAMATVAMLMGSVNINATDLWMLQNKWKSNTNLEINGNYKWVLRKNRYYGSQGFVNICKEDNNNNCLHIENGYLEMGKIKDGWWSSAWKITPTYSGFVKIQNKWRTNQYLNIEHGRLKSTSVYSGWWSYQWRKVKTANVKNDISIPSLREDRFTRDNDKQVVIDRDKQLMWQDDSAVKKTKRKWLTSHHYKECRKGVSNSCTNTSGDTAMSYCSNLQLGDYDNWRLPSKSELKSIVDKTKNKKPYIQKVFKNNPSDRYNFTWSSTTYNHIASWVVRFSNGRLQRYYKGGRNNVRCVRDSKEQIVPPIELLNTKPTANAGEDKTVTVNNSIILYGSGSDKEGSVTFEWKKDDEVLGTSKTLTYLPTVVGTDILTLVVTDEDGETTSDRVKIIVEKEFKDDTDIVIPTPTPSSPPIKDDKGKGITPTSTPSLPPIKDDKGKGTTPTSTPSLPPMKDDKGKGTTPTSTPSLPPIVVQNKKPVANAGLDKKVGVNQYVLLDASKSYDSDGRIVSIEWYKGSTRLGFGEKFYYKPRKIGTETLTLKVIDNNRATDTDSINITAYNDTTAKLTSVFPSKINVGIKNIKLYIDGINLKNVTKVFIDGVESSSFYKASDTRIILNITRVHGGNPEYLVPYGLRDIIVITNDKKIYLRQKLFVRE